MSNMNYAVEHTGHRWGKMAVSWHATEALAIAHAERTCGDAMRTEVYDCRQDPCHGTLIATFGSRGRAS